MTRLSVNCQSLCCLCETEFLFKLQEFNIKYERANKMKTGIFQPSTDLTIAVVTFVVNCSKSIALQPKLQIKKLTLLSKL